MEAPLSSGQKRWRINVFAATWSSYAGLYFCRKNFGIVKADVRDVLQVTDLEIAHIWTAYLAAYMCGQFLSAWLGKRIACRTLLLTGMAISVGCNFVFGFNTLMGPAGYWPLVAFMVINGFAQATGWPGNIGALASWFRRTERGTVMGLWATCYQLGSAMAKWFAALMFSVMGLAWSFWGAAVVLMGVWALFYFLGHDRPEDVGLEAIVVDEDPPSDGDSSVGEASAPDDGWTPAVRKAVMVMGGAYFSFKFLRYAIESWAPMLLKESFDLPTDTAGYISSLFDVLGFSSVLMSGFVTDRFFGGRRAAVTFGLSVALVFAAIYLRVLGPTSVFHFGLALGFIGFALYGPDSLLSGVGAIDVGSRKTAVTAAGVINGLGSFGALLQEELLGYLKTYHGPDAVFATLIFVAALGAVVCGVLWHWSRTGKSAF